jgi:hypothetical protein
MPLSRTRNARNTLACSRLALLGLAGAAALSAASCSFNNAATITETQLVHNTQELFDAVSKGDVEPWKKYFASDAMFFDEKGRSMDKTALLNDVMPLPPGYFGTIKLVSPQSRIIGNTAVVSYDLNETESIFGQNLNARYHETDTWLFRGGEWQIVAGQVLRYYEDPAAGRADPAKFVDYLGSYRLAAGKTLAVVAEASDLFIQKPNKPRELLITEAPDIFFEKGVEGRMLFRRADDGKVTALIDRRNNEDIVWSKVP